MTDNDVSRVKQAKFSMGIIIRMGRLIHKLQKERDMTILYIGQLGPGTKTFLLRNYEETDDAFTVSSKNLLVCVLWFTALQDYITYEPRYIFVCAFL